MPTAPVPANKSKNGRPGTAFPKMLKSASRTICDAGRRFLLTSQVNFRPRKRPATIRSWVRMELFSESRIVGNPAHNDHSIMEENNGRLETAP
jgi:hypothetical protein